MITKLFKSTDNNWSTQTRPNTSTFLDSNFWGYPLELQIFTKLVILFRRQIYIHFESQANDLNEVPTNISCFPIVTF